MISVHNKVGSNRNKYKTSKMKWTVLLLMIMIIKCSKV